MSRPAANITHRPAIAHDIRETIEQRAIERFVLKLIGNPPDIFAGHSVVARLIIQVLGHLRLKPFLVGCLCLKSSTQRSEMPA